jgi:RsiW-degrading membrane proteinase PrsW (M82 family)
MGFLASILFGFIPMFVFAWFVYGFDRYEKEPKILLGIVFIWGAVVAAGNAFMVNTFLGMGVFLMTGSEAITEFTTSSLVAPPLKEGGNTQIILNLGDELAELPNHVKI